MNRDEIKEKALGYTTDWLASVKDKPLAHVLSAIAGVLLYVIGRFFIK